MEYLEDKFAFKILADNLTEFEDGIAKFLAEDSSLSSHVMGIAAYIPTYYTSNTKNDELIYTPTYYYLGHFSKFIQAKAKRISTTSSRSQLLSTSFLNPDGTITAIVMNKTDDVIDYKLFVDNYAVKESILPHAIQTITF